MTGELKKVYGVVESVYSKETKNNTNMWKFKIDGRTYNWFTEENHGIKEGDYVEGLFYEMPNNQGGVPFKNISKLEVKEKPADYKQPEYKGSEEKPEKYDYGMAVNNATTLLASVVSCSHDVDTANDKMKELVKNDYENIIEALYHKTKVMREKLIGGSNKGE